MYTMIVIYLHFFLEFAVRLDIGTLVKLSKDNLSDTWFNKYD
jgi:hypothetical protein